MARKLREPELVDILAASNLEKKTDFEDKKVLEKLAKAIDKAKLDIDTKIVYDEEHSLYDLLIPGNASHPGDKKINWAFASTPEYKRLRASANLISEFDHPPFTVTRNGEKAVAEKIVKEKASDVLSYILEDAKKDFTITRFKGLGEMNPEQLWETTMNAETRTLLKVRLDDATAAEEIFSTLMGENVESRRKFIEENALEVVNLDI
jgi:DNA gyrase subunit B